MTVTPRILDLTDAIPPPPRRHTKVTPRQPLSQNPKQIRGRVRRAIRTGRQPRKEDLALLHKFTNHKPITEWDAEELARGMPRNKSGKFSGKKPTWITREVHEEAIQRFKQLIKDDVSSLTPDAVKVVQKIMMSEERDHKGRFAVAPSTKLAAAQFLIEHAIGKPVQHVEQDISVKLQGALAYAMVQPDQSTVLPALSAGEQEWIGQDDDDDIDDAELVDG